MTPDELQTMKLGDTDLSMRDREWVERVLQPGEELLMVCKPQARLWRSEYAYGALFAAVWIGMVALFTRFVVPTVLDEVAENPKVLFLLLFMLPFWLVSLVFMMAPWRNRTVARRTLYLLTNRRAVVLKPTFLLIPTQADYPMGSDMIRDIVVREDGSGDVVLGFAHHTKHGTHEEPLGFMRVPHVERVAALLRKHMPAAAPLPEPGVAGAGSRPFELSSDDDRPVEFPNVLPLIVGSVFVFFGATGVVHGWQQYVQSGTGGDWLMVILGVGFPGLFAAVGCRAVWSWVSDFRGYLSKKR